MADVNERISDLRNWDKINFNPTITKNGESYVVSHRYISGDYEKLAFKIYVKRNTNYKLTLTRSSTDHAKNMTQYNDYVVIATNKITASEYVERWNNSLIINKTIMTPGENEYVVEFNSDNHEELYVIIDFANFNDGSYFETTFKNIKLQVAGDEPDYIIESAYKTGYYFKKGNKIDVYFYLVLIRDESVLENLPIEITSGSWAYTAGGKKVWQLDFDGEWIPAFDEDE